MSQPTQLNQSQNEGRIELALQAIKQGQFKSVRRAAKAFNVTRSTLQRRYNGTLARANCQPNRQKLTRTEEQTIVRYILDLDLRGFEPRLCEVADMADKLLAVRGGEPVGKRWHSMMEYVTYRFHILKSIILSSSIHTYDVMLCHFQDAFEGFSLKQLHEDRNSTPVDLYPLSTVFEQCLHADSGSEGQIWDMVARWHGLRSLQNKKSMCNGNRPADNSFIDPTEENLPGNNEPLDTECAHCMKHA